jgi:hypothetical protein
MININELRTELKKKKRSYTYNKVKYALAGVPDTTTDTEKKELITILENKFKEFKSNILKS